jgi:MFS-type transporter involved in bile tolerance (Atg22 family)
VFSDRGDRIGPLALGMIALIAADGALAGGDTLTMVGLGVALWGLHMGLTQGLLAALVADAAPATLRGTAFGVFNLASGAALLVASWAAGVLWDIEGPYAAFSAGGFCALAALAGLLSLRRRFY